jgi:hypothetical protein
VTAYRLNYWGSVPDTAGDFYLLYSVQTFPGFHLAFRLIGIMTLFPWVKRQGPEPHHSPPTSAEVKNSGTMLPLSIYLHGVVLD